MRQKINEKATLCSIVLLFVISTKFGEIKMDVEEGKKENRSLGTFNFKLQDFIKKYKNEDMYMVESLPQLMKGELTRLA